MPPLFTPFTLDQAYVQSTETASRTLDADDAFAMLYANNGALIFTIDSGIFDEGVQISLCDFDGGGPVFAAGAGVTLQSSGALGPTAQYTVASVIRVPESLSTETFIVIGNV